MLFVGAVLLGFMIGLAYDLLRSIRRQYPKTLMVCDLLFSVILATGVIRYILAAAGGELRIYVLLGILLGAVFYFCTCSTFLRPLWDFWMETFVRFLALCAVPLLVLKKFFQKSAEKAKKLFHFATKWVRILNYKWEFVLIRRQKERSRSRGKSTGRKQQKPLRRRRDPR